MIANPTSLADSASLSLFPSGAVRFFDKEFQGSRLILIGAFEDVDENCDSEWVVNTGKEGRRLAWFSPNSMQITHSIMD